MARIVELNENLIRFDDGTAITAFHAQDCCEHNYADCEQLDDIARNTDFDTSKLEIDILQDQGFRFGNKPGKMFFVPCYSVQNGYYSTNLDIFVNGRYVGELDCREEFH